MLLSETHLTDKIMNREVSIANYNIIRSGSKSRHTGGVAIYIQKNLNYKIKSNEQIDNNMWILSIEITEHKDLNGLYTILYHSPSSSESKFLKYFSEWMEKNHSGEMKHLICGDFNIDMSENSNKILNKNKLNSIINDNGMIQIMKKPTRITEKTKTLIDLVITNMNEIKCEQNEKDNISDHTTIHIIWNNVINMNENIEKKTILYKYNKQQLENELKKENYSFCFDENISCSKKAEKLISILKKSVYTFKK